MEKYIYFLIYYHTLIIIIVTFVQLHSLLTRVRYSYLTLWFSLCIFRKTKIWEPGFIDF